MPQSVVGFDQGFNPRSREGNDWSNLDNYIQLFQFQSTFPRGERLCWDTEEISARCVSIHVPARGTTFTIAKKAYSAVVFQSTFPRGERLNYAKSSSPSKEFQSTFPRGERRHMSIQHTRSRQVSIHVPARGTTEQMRALAKALMVSIHVPARGTTIKSFFHDRREERFNPRSREGNDRL